MRGLSKALAAAALLSAILVIFPLALGAAQDTSASASGQIPLAVRVWEGNKFVPDLKVDDFEVTVNGLPQPVSSLFFVDRSSVTRREGTADALPDTSRRFYFLFQLFEYNPRIGDGIRDFFSEAFLPGDSLSIQTPIRNYILSAKSLAAKPRDVLAKEMIEIVRRDVTEGGLAYKSILRDLRRIVMSIGSSYGSANPMSQSNVEDGGNTMENFGIESLLMQYREPLARMDALRQIDERKIVSFAQSLKNVPGQKIVFFVYQREFNPELAPSVMNTLIDANQDNQNVLSAVHELFQTYHRNVSLDPQRIGQSFAASGVDFNLLFINKDPDHMAGIVMREQSEDVFKVFAQTAQTTGGIVDNSQDPGIAIKDALKASEKYYLLYFEPPAGVPSGSFAELKVTVKGKDYKILNRRVYQTE